MVFGAIKLTCLTNENEYTINIHKRTHKHTYKQKAPRAMREIRKFAESTMFTKDVRIDTSVNKLVWSKGIHGVPRRIRVRLERKKNDDEEAKEKVYTLVSVADATSLRGLGTVN